MKNILTCGAGKFLRVPARSLRLGTRAPVDVFMRFEPEIYALFLAAGREISSAVHHKMTGLGVRSLYVRSHEIEFFYNYIEANLTRFTSGDLSVDADSVSFLYESTDQLMEHLLEDLKAPLALRRLTTAVEATVTSILRDKNTLWNMLAVASHDFYTYTHSINVAAMMIASCSLVFGFEKKKLIRMGLGAMLHDIGKERIPDAILKKPGELSASEFRAIMQHPILGIEIAGQCHDICRYIKDIIASHHEKYDGGGYPTGVSSKRLNEAGRMAKIVDVYDALTSQRPYGPAHNPWKAVKIMGEEMPGHFDRRLMEEFFKVLGFRSSERIP